MFPILLTGLAAQASAGMIKNWKASLQTPADPSSYKVVFEWDHDASEAVTIGFKSGLKPTDDARCSGSSAVNAADGQPFWMPRFFQKPVSSEIQQQTGIQFASVDWQPCGHKDIVICHGESHYDFHLYYVSAADLASRKMCDIGTKANPRLPVCEDSANPVNNAYFKLINQNMPLSAQITSAVTSGKVDKKFDYCVDASSAILRSGVHYGDKSETLQEWKTPVTIIGSHDCKMEFFEPMISEKWISGEVPDSSWPFYEVSDIKYNQKTFQALPSAWSINVSKSCKKGAAGLCHIQLIVQGTKCPSGGCVVKRECGSMKSCVTGKPYVSKYTSNVTVPTRSSTATTTSLAKAGSSTTSFAVARFRICFHLCFFVCLASLYW